MKTKSIVTEDTYACYFCGMPAQCEHHLLFGNGIRELAEEDGLKVPSCNMCHTIGKLSGRVHDNAMAEKLSKKARTGNLREQTGNQGAIYKEIWKIVSVGRRLIWIAV